MGNTKDDNYEYIQWRATRARGKAIAGSSKNKVFDYFGAIQLTLSVAGGSGRRAGDNDTCKSVIKDIVILNFCITCNIFVVVEITSQWVQHFHLSSHSPRCSRKKQRISINPANILIKNTLRAACSHYEISPKDSVQILVHIVQATYAFHIVFIRNTRSTLSIHPKSTLNSTYLVHTENRYDYVLALCVLFYYSCGVYLPRAYVRVRTVPTLCANRRKKGPVIST